MRVFSDAIDSWLALGILVLLVLLVGAFDWLFFTNLDSIIPDAPASQAVSD